MKFFLAIFSIVMMVQVSMATEKFDEAKFAESLLKFFSEYAVAVAKAVHYVDEKMPTTEEYAPYRLELTKFKEDFKAFDEHKDICFKKIYTFISKFHELMNRLAKSDKPEAKFIEGLLFESIDDDFLTQFEHMMMSVFKYAFAEESSEEHTVDFAKLKELLNEVC